MTDTAMVLHFGPITEVFTPRHHVRNRIEGVTPHSVKVRSDRTGRLREIPFADIRNADNVTRNGVVVRALRDTLAASSSGGGAS
jgi:hypothetical protein